MVVLLLLEKILAFTITIPSRSVFICCVLHLPRFPIFALPLIAPLASTPLLSVVLYLPPSEPPAELPTLLSSPFLQLSCFIHRVSLLPIILRSKHITGRPIPGPSQIPGAGASEICLRRAQKWVTTCISFERHSMGQCVYTSKHEADEIGRAESCGRVPAFTVVAVLRGVGVPVRPRAH